MHFVREGEAIMRLAICDDEPRVLADYQGILATISEKLGVSATIDVFHSGKELMFALEGTGDPIDILFLDVNMPELTGVELARWMRERDVPCEIIFLTVSQVHMLHAFDVGAFHYVVKEKTPANKFEDIVARAFEKVGQKKQEVITVSCAGESRRIPLADITYFEVQNYIIIVHYADTSFEFYSTLSKIENTLLGRGFARTHRSYLVNLAHMRTLMRQELVLDNGTHIPVGRKYTEELRHLIHDRGTASEDVTPMAIGDK